MATATVLTAADMEKVSIALFDLIGLHSEETDDALVNANDAVCEAWEAIEDATDPDSRTDAQRAARQAVSRAYAVVSALHG
ncbi:hypothetical protein [Streptomyces sp. NPDC016172]|uniref:hypothetical protein n=1 Tax=Streptomyces sp. NPDC016172 TaxID=3364964 RepID=UPI0037000027